MRTAVVLLFLCSIARAATITVDLAGGGDHTDIQAGILGASDGDVVLVKPGEYVVTQPVSFRGKAIALRSEGGADAATIRMSDTPEDPLQASVVVFTGGETPASVLEGFTITGGRGTRYGEAGCCPLRCVGGGILSLAEDAPTIVSCRIVGNEALRDDSRPMNWGGGVYATAVTLIDCVVAENIAERGAGVVANAVTLTNCTIAGNVGEEGIGGVWCEGGAITSCIVWGNVGDSIASYGELPVVAYSCIAGAAPWPGTGNIAQDPLFCGWDSEQMYVDGAAQGPGTGTWEDPFEDLRFALRSPGYRVSLSAASPCRGTGEGGADMGAAAESCDRQPHDAVIVHAAPGSYRAPTGAGFVQGVGIQGAGEGETVIRGTILGLRTGAAVSDLTVTEGRMGGIYVTAAQAPEISRVLVRDNRGSLGAGIICRAGAAPSLVHVTIAENRADAAEGWFRAYGSGLALWDAAVTAAWCSIIDNEGAAAVESVRSSLTLTECTVARNGGAAISLQEGSAFVTACLLAGNGGGEGGGGLSCAGGSVTLAGSTIERNLNLTSDGGGLGCTKGGSAVCTNCIIEGNEAQRGGGIHCDAASSVRLSSCTVAVNAADLGGGVFCEGQADIASCILWGNVGGSLVAAAGAAPIISYSCVERESPWPGIGNTNADPRFCAWGARQEVFVDGSNPAPGDGTAQNPFSDLAEGLARAGYSLALSLESPCRGAGEGGIDMGAALEPCEAEGQPAITVRVGPGTYTAIAGAGLACRVSILGAGAGSTFIRGSLSGLRTGSVLSDVTVTAGTAGGLRVRGADAPLVRRCVFSGNAGDTGGSLHVSGTAAPVAEDCTFSSNTAGQGGAVFVAGSSTLTLARCTVAGNTAGLGGGIYLAGKSVVALSDCTITGNTAVQWYDFRGGGGLLCRDETRAMIVRTTIAGNRALNGGRGGGLWCRDSASVALSGCAIRGNRALSGGGVYGWGGSITLAGCVIARNEAEYDSGGVGMESGVMTLEDCVVSNNKAGTHGRIGVVGGGGVSCRRNAAVVLARCVVSENDSYSGGGIWCAAEGSVTLEACTISGNAGDDAGGVLCEGTVDMTGSIVWDNVGLSLARLGVGMLSVRYSCVEYGTLWPGEGNIGADPRFCGWSLANAYVDGSNAGPADGSSGHPFPDLASGLATIGYGLSLSAQSPCRGAGPGGGDMGAPLGGCDSPGAQSVTVHVAAGTYSGLSGAALAHRVSIRGAGADATVIEGGSMGGLRTGAVLADLTVARGAAGGLAVRGREAPVVSRCSISDNEGGGIVVSGTARPSFSDCTIAGNFDVNYNGPALHGGVSCWNDAEPVFLRCAVLGNTADRGAGVLCADAAAPMFIECTILGNAASGGQGGGVGCQDGASPAFVSCRIAKNRADFGGGVGSSGESGPFLSGCTIMGNAAFSGGGVGAYDESSPRLVNCVISGNDASYRGGGVHAGVEHGVAMVNCTISGNRAEEPSGGLWCSGDLAVKLTNCIVWGNTPESVCGEPAHCLTDQDPLFEKTGVFDFDRYANVVIGGREYELPLFVVDAPSYRLLPGSPAIDAGTDLDAPRVDIERRLRPCGGGIDAGAYESGGCPIAEGVFRRGDANADGTPNIADPIFIISHLFANGAPPGCPDAADANDDGVIDIADPIWLLAHLFARQSPPPDPFDACGVDPSGDGLDCPVFPPCW